MSLNIVLLLSLNNVLVESIKIDNMHFEIVPISSKKKNKNKKNRTKMHVLPPTQHKNIENVFISLFIIHLYITSFINLFVYYKLKYWKFILKNLPLTLSDIDLKQIGWPWSLKQIYKIFTLLTFTFTQSPWCSNLAKI